MFHEEIAKTTKLAWPVNCKKQNALKLALPISTQYPLSQSAATDHVSPAAPW